MHEILAGRLLPALVLCACVGIGAHPAAAQSWPTHPITLVAPYPAGGNLDIAARLFAKELSLKLGQAVVVENKAGGGGAVASIYVANAKPDGYTLLLTGSGPAVFNKLMYKSISYDPDSEFTPIIATTNLAHVLVVNPKLPVRNLKELLEYAKRKPEGLTIGHGGVGSTGQLAALLFLEKTGMKGVLVAYRGTAPLIEDVLGGQIDMGFPAYVPQVASVRALNVTSEARLSFLPDVPTFRESGVDVVATTWNGLVGPVGMPHDIVEKINSILNTYLHSDTGKKDVANLGAQPLGGPPEDLTKIMNDEKIKWGPIIKAAHISLD